MREKYDNFEEIIAYFQSLFLFPVGETLCFTERERGMSFRIRLNREFIFILSHLKRFLIVFLQLF